MPRSKGNNTCDRCKKQFTSRQGRFRHVRNVKCEEVSLAIVERVAMLEKEVQELRNNPGVQVFLNLNTFGHSGGGVKMYPSYKEVKDMEDILNGCINTSNLNGLVKYLHFNEDFPKNKTIRNAKDGMIDVYVNGWKQQKGEEVYEELTELFGDIFSEYLSYFTDRDRESLPNAGSIGVFYRNIVKPFDWDLEENIIKQYKLIEWSRTSSQRPKIYENLRKKVYDGFNDLIAKEYSITYTMIGIQS
jgi:hypothetical protein